MDSPAAADDTLGETLSAFAQTETPGTPLTTREVADAAGCTRRTAYDRLQRLADRGAVETKKVGARGRVWWRPPGEVTDGGQSGADLARSDGDHAGAGATGGPPCGTGEVSHGRVTAALDAAEAAVFVLDDEFEVVWANRGVERYFGLDRDEVVGRDQRTVVRAEIADVVADGDQFVETVLSSYEDGRGGRAVDCRVTAGDDREERWLEHRSSLLDPGRCAGGRVEVYYDVTERRRHERDHDAGHDCFERILETNLDGVVVFAADGSTVAANAVAAELLGVPAEDAASYTMGDAKLLDPSGDVVPFDERPIPRVSETGEPVSDVELQVEHSDDESKWLRLDAAPIEDESGTVTHVVTTATDVTRLKEQSRRLARRRDALERELEEVFERVDDAFYALDDEWQLTYVNDRAAEVFGQSREELLGRTLWEVLPGDADHDSVRSHYETAMATQEPVHFETFYESWAVWVEVNAYPSESGLSVYFRDVTERKERERERERYETVVETVDDGIFALDPDGRFTMVNDALAEMTGYDRERMLGAHVALVHSEAVDEEGADVAAVGRDTGGSASLDFDLQPAEGDPVPVESRFAPYEYGDDTALTGIVRDVSERKRFEAMLTALHDTSRELLDATTRTEVSETVVEAVTETLDLPGVAVYRHDEATDELVPDAASLTGSVVDGEPPTVPADAGITGRVLEEGRTRRFEDVRNSPHLYDGVRETPVRGALFVPLSDHGVLLVGSREVGGIGHETHQLVELLAANAAAAYDRVDREEEVRRQRDRLRALDDLNAVVRGINEALVDQSSREEVAQVVCERLAASESYDFAWFGDVDPKTGMVESRIEVGVDGYLPEIPVATDSDDVPDGPVSRAIRTHEVQVVDDALEDPLFEQWREYAREYGYRSAAAVPVVHDDTLYGVVGVYASQPNAFDGEKRAVVGQLREVVGYALASIERKRALMSDEVAEVEFRIRDVFEAMGAPTATDEPIRFDRVVPTGDGAHLLYGSVPRGALDAVRALVECQSHWEALTVLARDRDATTFEVRLSEPPVVSLVAARGGYLEGAMVEGGDYHMTLHLPPGDSAQQVIAAVEKSYPGVELLTRRRVTRTGEPAEPLGRALADRVTERQRAAIEAAFYSGYFEWPRDSTGEDVADSLGVSAPTFHQHVRNAQRKLLEALYEGDG